MGHDAHHPPIGGFGLAKGWTIIMGPNVLHKWHSSMLDQQALGKKNVPPQPTSKPNHKRPWVNKVATTTKVKWTNKLLEETMDVVEKGICSLKIVGKFWNILP